MVLDFVKSGARIRQIWCSISLNLVLNFVKPGASCGGPWWCSISSNLVLEFVKSGARFRPIWCSILPNLVLEFVKSGARFRLIWCSISLAGARFRKAQWSGWCQSRQSGDTRAQKLCSGWCLNSSNLVLESLNLVLDFAKSGARIRLIWCSNSANLVLEFVKSGARIRQITPP